MTMRTIRARMKAYIQPFERVLAVQEMRVAAEASLDALKQLHRENEFEVLSQIPVVELASRLAYWEMIVDGAREHLTTQAVREATVNVVRNGIDLTELRETLPFSSNPPLPNRRCLRYGPHGIHEYRGKFFPQLVRSLINIAGVGPGDLVVDTMSGSGTTLVEAALMGCRGLGLDMNPLSVFLGNTKCQLLSADAVTLQEEYSRVRESLLGPDPRRSHRRKYFQSLSESDRNYLNAWFSEDVLDSLDDIAVTINGVKDKPSRNLMWISLSNVLRNVSWQKADDLRVRKEVRLDVDIDPKREFLEELGRSVRAVLALLLQSGPVPHDLAKVSQGDARFPLANFPSLRGAVDVVVTSPPYATALPYLDTDRLSLCYLGLLSRSEHRAHEYCMIGNREVSERLRRSYWERFEREGHCLPHSVRVLIHHIRDKNAGSSAGFRRLNLPSLLAKYFLDMRDALDGIHALLKPNAIAFVVVGNNHTIAGGERVEIYTASLLRDIAQTIGFEAAEPLPMEMLASRDIFKKNASTSEEILAFRKRT